MFIYDTPYGEAIVFTAFVSLRYTSVFGPSPPNPRDRLDK